MYNNVVTAIDKIHTYLLRFNKVDLVAVAAGGGGGVGLVVVVGAATAARICGPLGQLVAALGEYTRPPQGQTVSVVGEHRKP